MSGGTNLHVDDVFATRDDSLVSDAVDYVARHRGCDEADAVHIVALYVRTGRALEDLPTYLTARADAARAEQLARIGEAIAAANAEQEAPAWL